MFTNMIIIIFLCLYLTANNSYVVHGRINNISLDHEDLELEKQLKLINKPPLKTIQEDGYIIDCIDIYKQPAFDNPLLKNHTIQLKPSFEVKSTESTMLSSIEIEEDLCPKGTIPIRRTTKDDLIRAKQLLDMDVGILNKDIPGRHYAGLNLKQNDLRYSAIGGTVSVYNLPLKNADQITSAYIYLSNGNSVKDRNVIMAGWEEHPKVFGNGQTYFFVRWADKSKNKGCTNLFCPGFVQTEPRFMLGKPVGPISIYDKTIADIWVDITHDPKTNNWWVLVRKIPLGYFPGNLFSNLPFAKLGGWTGMTSTPKGIPSPPMGSGHFPDTTLFRSCYFGNLSFGTDNMKNIAPEKPKYALESTDSPNCFGVQYGFFQGRIMLLFGGPGGNCGE